ncbi:acetyl-CoA carboxylase biotin carboxyl carrier protein, partial [Collinsella intestinalis]|uniref:acetyl-CoA carboxylase biotin carboxyl carrier protein n=1 Tax=Collinsella intestinalis TaxID=147207 RepID=UPI001956F356
PPHAAREGDARAQHEPCLLPAHDRCHATRGRTRRAAAPAATDRPATWKAVESPMVGTFYQAPAPDADPFVKIGDTVKAGQTLCIVEAMKLMNEITAEEDGIVREVCGKNAEPVEFGQPLFYLEPTA